MSTQTLIFGGDFTLGKDPEKFMEGVNDLLDKADFRMLQMEEPFLDKMVERATEERLTKTLDCCKGKFDLVTLSGNHFYDFGEDGVSGTLGWLDRNGVVHTGGGHDIEEASKPAFVEKNGTKIGVIGFNAIGGKQQFASSDRGGTSFVNFIRGYIPTDELDQVHKKLENDIWSLKEPVHMDKDFMGFNFIDPDSYMDYAQRIYEAKKQCDILLVYLHKGYVHKQVMVDSWERFISHIAIDNGADAVVASHSHIAHGVEMYKGKAIYHGLNNFVMYTPQLSPQFTGKVHGDAHNEEWVKQRVKRFGFVPDPEYPTYPFHPDSVYCPVAKFVIEDKKIVSNRMVLMKVEKSGIPYVHGHTKTGEEIFNFMDKITKEAGLNAKLSWVGDEVEITE